MIGGHAVPRLACHAWAFGNRGYPAALDCVATHGFRAVDLPIGSADDAGALALDSLIAGETAARAVLEDLDRNRLQLTDVFVILPFPLNDRSFKHRRAAFDAFMRTILAIEILGAPGMTVSPGVRFPGEPAQASFRRSVQALRTLVAAAAQASLALSIEPHLGSIVGTPEDVSRLIDEVPGLSLTLDYSHFIAAGIAQRSVEPLHAFARHFHIRQSRPGRLAAPMAEGAIDFARIFDLLKQQKYLGDVTVEYADSPWMGQNLVDIETETTLMAAEVRSHISRLWGGLPLA